MIICVPTPLTTAREPDLAYLISAGEAVAGNLRQGQLVVLESTTYPGTTGDRLRPILEEATGLRAGQDFSLAFAGRIDPGGPTTRCARRRRSSAA
ncbi:MAG: hypothetical protein U0R71_16385 [Solirubrobacterales bacterium]